MFLKILYALSQFDRGNEGYQREEHLMFLNSTTKNNILISLSIIVIIYSTTVEKEECVMSKFRNDTPLLLQFYTSRYVARRKNSPTYSLLNIDDDSPSLLVAQFF